MKSPRIIAHYLPQYHPCKENDKWWGKGFTEWTNVGKAKPLFKGHDQPRVPTELGYYDLRMSEIREEQAALAKEAGVEGFMYWHYWFGNGKTLLADIFKEVLESGKPDYPFCLGWANHSWYAKNWNGTETTARTLLMEQTYPGEEDARMYFNTLLPAFRDHRYIKVDGKPLFYIYAPQDLPIQYLEWFRQWTKEAGLPGLYVVANVIKKFEPKEKYLDLGYDAVCYSRIGVNVDKTGKLSSNIFKRAYNRGKKILKGYLMRRPPYMQDYRECAEAFCTEAEKARDVIPVIMPNWDHTPRSGWNGSLLVNDKPEYFKDVVLKAIDTVKDKPEQERIILLKSWNEWGEGNYMEPDLTHGRGYVNALKEALETVNIFK